MEKEYWAREKREGPPARKEGWGLPRAWSRAQPGFPSSSLSNVCHAPRLDSSSDQNSRGLWVQDCRFSGCRRLSADDLQGGNSKPSDKQYISFSGSDSSPVVSHY